MDCLSKFYLKEELQAQLWKLADSGYHTIQDKPVECKNKIYQGKGIIAFQGNSYRNSMRTLKK